MGNGKCYIFFIGTDLWLIFIFQGWEMGNVLESVIPYYSPQTGPITIHCATELSAECNYIIHHICVVCSDVKSPDGW